MIELSVVQACAIDSKWVLEVFAGSIGRGCTIEDALVLYQNDFDPNASAYALWREVVDMKKRDLMELVCEVPPTYRMSRVGRRTLEMQRAANKTKSLKLRGFTRVVGPFFNCELCGDRIRDVDAHENGGCSARRKS